MLRVPFRFLAVALHASTRAFAQTPNAQTPNAPELPVLEVSPATLNADGIFTLSMQVAPQGKSTRVAIYEHDRPTKLAEIKKKFEGQNGRWSTQVQLQADPGSYDFRIVSDDKTRAPLSSDAGVLVPGIVREPGWWLLNGLPFFGFPKDNDAPAPSGAPLFVPGLKRNDRKFDRKTPVSGGVALTWKVIDYYPPDDFTRSLSSVNFNAASPHQIVAQQLEKARQSGQRNYLGFEIHFGSVYDANPNAEGIRAFVSQLRKEIQIQAPEGALILGVDGTRLSSSQVARRVEACADLCDAVVLNLDPHFNSSWLVKVARRVAEEQPNYDLPILVNWSTIYFKGGLTYRRVAEQPVLLGYFMGGAISTGRDTQPDQFSGRPPRVVEWGKSFVHNAPLFVGSATLEDAGLLLPLDIKNINEDQTENLYCILQDAGRIPGAARIQAKTDKKIPESFLCVLGDSISGETIEKLRIAANGGARIYLEGSPKIEGDAARWNALVGAASTPVETKAATMTLDDVWLFGDARGSKVLVQQSVRVGALNGPTSKPKKDGPEKGKDVLTAPRVVAKLEDGSPALIENPVGDGEVLWSPQRILAGNSTRTPTPHISEFYDAIAAHLGTGLLKIRVADGASTLNVRAAIRRSAQGTWLVGLFNESTQDAPIVLDANHFAGVALDLQSEKELPLDTRGNRSSIQTTVPASGWQIIALGESRAKLDDERFAPRSKVRLK